MCIRDRYEGHFRHLRDLYDKNELTSAINRVVEDINHRFTLEVLAQIAGGNAKVVGLPILRQHLQREAVVDRCV